MGRHTHTRMHGVVYVSFRVSVSLETGARKNRRSECRRVGVEERKRRRRRRRRRDGVFRWFRERGTKDEEDKIDSVVKSKLQGNEQLAATSRD